MSTSNISPQTPPAPTASRVTFQSTPNSAVNFSRSSNEGPVSPNFEFLKWEVFENILTQLFTKGVLAVLTSKDALLKEKKNASSREITRDVRTSILIAIRTGETCTFARGVSMLMKAWRFHTIQNAVLESLHLTSRQLGYDYPWTVCSLALYAS